VFVIFYDYRQLSLTGHFADNRIILFIKNCESWLLALDSWLLINLKQTTKVRSFPIKNKKKLELLHHKYFSTVIFLNFAVELHRNSPRTTQKTQRICQKTL
jgi:hypothetical protein